MTRRIALIGVLLFAVPSLASGQGRPPQQVVISPSTLKEMTSQKPKSKKPLAVRAGAARRAKAGALARSSAPTSVREILPKAGK